MTTPHATWRSSDLRLEQLESRQTPANMLAVMSPTGLLTVTGTDYTDVVAIKDSGFGIDLIGFGATTINGLATASFPTVNAIYMSAKEGDDIIGLDAAVNLDLNGALKIDLGGGNNTLSLQSAGTIKVGSVLITSKSGIDDCQVGSTNTTITGNFAANLGNGANKFNIKSGTNIQGHLKLTAGEGIDTLGIASTTVGKNATIALGNGITGGTLHNLTVQGNLSYHTGHDSDILTWTQIVVNGPTGVQINLGDDDFIFDINGVNSVTAGNFVLDGGFQYLTAFLGQITLDGPLTVAGDMTVRSHMFFLNVNHTLATRNLILKGDEVADLDLATVTGTMAIAENVSLFSRGNSIMRFDGASFNIGGSLSITGQQRVQARFANANPSTIGRNLTIMGGPDGDDEVRIGKNLTVNRNTSITLGNGFSEIELGKDGPGVAFVGNLTITMGNAADNVVLDQISVFGNTLINLGDGGDVLTVDGGASFSGRFTANAGLGDDSLLFGQEINLTSAAVTFGKRAIIRGNQGNDQILLGLIPQAGDSNSRIAFFDPLSLVDGGSGIDLYNPASSQYTGLPLSQLVHWE